MHVIFTIVRDGDQDRDEPDLEAQLDVVPGVGETVSLPRGLHLTVRSVTHYPFGAAAEGTEDPCVVLTLE